MNDLKTTPLPRIGSAFRSFKPSSSILVQRLDIDGAFLGSFNICCPGKVETKRGWFERAHGGAIGTTR